MAKFRITGTDRDSGFETSIIIEAPHQDAAEQEAIRRGIAVRHVEEVSPHLESIDLGRLQEVIAMYEHRPEASVPSNPVLSVDGLSANRLWMQVAVGVCVGLLAYSLTVALLTYGVYRWTQSKRLLPSVASTPVVTIPVANPPHVGHFKATNVAWRFQETFVEISWSATVISEYDRPWRCMPVYVFRYETGEKLGEQSGEPMTILPGKTQLSGRFFVTADAFNISTEKDIVFRP